MIAEPTKPEELLVVIRNWFRLCAEGRWVEATAMLDVKNSDDTQWTPELIQDAVNLVYAPGCRFCSEHPEGPLFSNPDTATGILHADVLELKDGSGFVADHDVPLNGVWSDLTAQFEFLRGPEGLTFVLYDLHVL